MDDPLNFAEAERLPLTLREGSAAPVASGP